MFSARRCPGSAPSGRRKEQVAPYKRLSLMRRSKVLARFSRNGCKRNDLLSTMNSLARRPISILKVQMREQSAGNRATFSGYTRLAATAPNWHRSRLIHLSRFISNTPRSRACWSRAVFFHEISGVSTQVSPTSTWSRQAIDTQTRLGRAL